MPNFLMILGGVLIVLGLLWPLGIKLNLFSLPGDIRIEKENFKFYFPLTTSILLSLMISLIMLLIKKMK
ncbi:DUF2905 domain-containing protein [archaeon]|nr:DUF2905 domain-containing protein [archaeon]